MPEVIHQNDVSQKALYIAKSIDRLPPGEYTIRISRPASKERGWSFEVQKTDTVLPMREIYDKRENVPQVVDL